MSPKTRLGDEERRLMHLVPAPAVRLMKRRVLSRPGVNSLMVLLFHTPGLNTSSFRAREKEEEVNKAGPRFLLSRARAKKGKRLT